MLKIFQRNMALQMVLVAVALLLLWLRPLAAPPELSAGEHPALFYSLLCSWLSATPRLAVILAMLLVLIEGILLNLLLADVGLVSQNSLLPALFFVVSISAGASTLTPAILVWGVMIACLNQLVLRGTLLTIPSSKICGATVLIGIASLCYQPAAALLLSYIFIAINYRLYNWKELAVMLLGFAAPYVAVVAVLFLTGGLADWWQGLVAGWAAIGTHLGHFTLLQALGTALLFAVLLWGLFSENIHLSEHPVVWQRNASTLMLLTVGAIGMVFYSPLQPATLQLFALPFAFCATRLFPINTTGVHRHIRHPWRYDLLLILIFIAALVC